MRIRDFKRGKIFKPDLKFKCVRNKCGCKRELFLHDLATDNLAKMNDKGYYPRHGGKEVKTTIPPKNISLLKVLVTKSPASVPVTGSPIGGVANPANTDDTRTEMYP